MGFNPVQSSQVTDAQKVDGGPVNQNTKNGWGLTNKSINVQIPSAKNQGAALNHQGDSESKTLSDDSVKHNPKGVFGGNFLSALGNALAELGQCFWGGFTFACVGIFHFVTGFYFVDRRQDSQADTTDPSSPETPPQHQPKRESSVTTNANQQPGIQQTEHHEQSNVSASTNQVNQSSVQEAKREPSVDETSMRGPVTYENKAYLLTKLEGRLLDSEFDEIVEAKLDLSRIQSIVQREKYLATASQFILSEARCINAKADLQGEFEQLQELDTSNAYTKQIESLRTRFNEAFRSNPDDVLLGKLKNIHAELLDLRSQLPRPKLDGPQSTTDKLSQTLRKYLLPSEIREVAKAGLATEATLQEANGNRESLSRFSRMLLGEARWLNNVGPLRDRVDLLVSHNDASISEQAKKIQERIRNKRTDKGRKWRYFSKTIRQLTAECDALIRQLPKDHEIRLAAYKPSVDSA